MDTIQTLVSRYLDGELADEELERLAGMLRTDVDAVDRLVLAGFVHSHLTDWMDRQLVQDDVVYGAIAAGDTARTQSNLFELGVPVDDLCCDLSDLSDDSDVVPWRFWPRSLAARAAAVVFAVGLVFAAYSFASRPVIVAQLTQAAGCQWDAAQAGTSVGELLESGRELKLVKGQALLTFVNGAQLQLEGPVTLRLNSTSEVDLRHGFVAAKVPTQAIGFTVITSLARFVDLGTQFTVKLDAEKTFEIYVFVGMVELTLDERFGAAVHHPVRLGAVQAMYLDEKIGDVKPLPFNQGEKMPF
jgi:hypothetical protein